MHLHSKRRLHTFVSFFALLLHFGCCCKCKGKRPDAVVDETKEMIRVRVRNNKCFRQGKKEEKEKTRRTRVMEEKKGGLDKQRKEVYRQCRRRRVSGVRDKNGSRQIQFFCTQVCFKVLVETLVQLFQSLLLRFAVWTAFLALLSFLAQLSPALIVVLFIGSGLRRSW